MCAFQRGVIRPLFSVFQAVESRSFEQSAREAREADEQLARRLQQEEDLCVPVFSHLPGSGLPPVAMRRGPGDDDCDWLNGLLANRAGQALNPFAPGGMFGSGRPLIPPPRRGGGRGGQLAHLSLLDRDFDEDDYEMLLQLDRVDG